MLLPAGLPSGEEGSQLAAEDLMVAKAGKVLPQREGEGLSEREREREG